MKRLNNQTLWQCEYCGKRLLSKKGADIHENSYCWHPESPHQKGIMEKQRQCEHKNTETIYRYIPGEAVQEPDYEQCIDCQKKGVSRG